MKKYESKHRAWLVWALFAVLISTVSAVVLQFFKGQVLDHAIAGNGLTTLRSGLLLISFILLEVLAFYVYKRLSFRFSADCFKELKEDIFNSFLSRNYVTFKERQQGEYTAKYTQDADAIRVRRFGMLPLLWEILLKIIFVSAALFWLDWRVALITIAMLTTPLYVPKLIESRLQQAQTEQLKAAEDALVKLNDWLNGFEVIKNFSIEARIMRQFRNVNDRAAQKLLADMGLSALAQLLTTLISYLSYFAVLAFSAWLVLMGNFTAGEFFVAIGMIDQLSYPLISLAEILRQLISIRPACREMEQFLHEAPTQPVAQRACEVRRAITWQDVTFGYQPERQLLNQFNLTMKKGGRYLLRGPSGSGKTTVVNLLMKYYNPRIGTILIDDTPIEKLDSTYGYVTVVRQDAVLFHDSLRDNLTMYGNIPEEQLISILEAVGLHQFASTQGLDMMLTEGGDNLSGGEKKRISLARALLRSTDVLILDEPLANLDPNTAQRIEDLLLSFTDQTVLVVSHQFSQEKLSAFTEVVDLQPA